MISLGFLNMSEKTWFFLISPWGEDSKIQLKENTHAAESRVLLCVGSVKHLVISGNTSICHV